MRFGVFLGVVTQMCGSHGKDEMKRVRLNCSQLIMNRDLGDIYVLKNDPYDTPFCGIGVTFYPDGTLHTETEFIDGMDIGVKQIWYPSGQIQRETPGIDTENGIIREWHPNGRLAFYARIFLAKILEALYWDETGAVIHHHLAPGENYQIEGNME